MEKHGVIRAGLTPPEREEKSAPPGKKSAADTAAAAPDAAHLDIDFRKRAATVACDTLRDTEL